MKFYSKFNEEQKQFFGKTIFDAINEFLGRHPLKAKELNMETFASEAFSYMMHSFISISAPPLWTQAAPLNDFFSEDFERECCLHIINVYQKEFQDLH